MLKKTVLLLFFMNSAMMWRTCIEAAPLSYENNDLDQYPKKTNDDISKDGLNSINDMAAEQKETDLFNEKKNGGDAGSYCAKITKNSNDVARNKKNVVLAVLKMQTLLKHPFFSDPDANHDFTRYDVSNLKEDYGMNSHDKTNDGLVTSENDSGDAESLL